MPVVATIWSLQTSLASSSGGTALVAGTSRGRAVSVVSVTFTHRFPVLVALETFTHKSGRGTVAEASHLDLAGRSTQELTHRRGGLDAQLVAEDPLVVGEVRERFLPVSLDE